MHEAEARIALVMGISRTTGRQEVLGVITDREIAKAAYAIAKLVD